MEAVCLVLITALFIGIGIELCKRIFVRKH